MSFRLSVLARRATAILAFAGISVMAACGGDDPTGPDGEVYTLYSVESAVVPVTVTDADGTYSVKSGAPPC